MKNSPLAIVLFSAAVPVSIASTAGQSPLVQNGSAPAGELYDIYPPVPLAEPVNWPLYLAGVVALLILAALVFWFIRSRKKEVIITSDPRAEALAALDGARKLIDDNQPLTYAAEASEILRRFIETSFSITSTRQTTTEFLAALGADPASSEQLHVYRDELKGCLASCDLAKYARKPANREQLEEIDRAIRNFITSAGKES